jgi:glycosyltransferase involved in cell wall biosynthesis
VNGLVVEPTPGALATAANRLAANRREAAQLGDAGYEAARAVTWDGVIEKLVS